MEREETVSIVMPVFNAAPYLREAVESVRNQTWQDWELLMVDDHSRDDSRRIMEELAREDGRIRLFSTGEGEKGAADARNLGTRHAAGRYLAFLDSDDLWMAEKLEKELAFLRQKEAAFAFTSYEFGDEAARGTGKVVRAPQCLTYQKALSRTVIFTSTVLFDLEKIPKELLYMPRVASEDTATWWQILRAGYCAYGLEDTLTVYRRPQKSLSSNKLAAVSRIWNLYRRQEKLSLVRSVWHFCFWALFATLRRI